MRLEEITISNMAMAIKDNPDRVIDIVIAAFIHFPPVPDREGDTYGWVGSTVVPVVELACKIRPDLAAEIVVAVMKQLDDEGRFGPIETFGKMDVIITALKVAPDQMSQLISALIKSAPKRAGKVLGEHLQRQRAYEEYVGLCAEIIMKSFQDDPEKLQKIYKALPRETFLLED